MDTYILLLRINGFLSSLLLYVQIGHLHLSLGLGFKVFRVLGFKVGENPLNQSHLIGKLSIVLHFWNIATNSESKKETSIILAQPNYCYNSLKPIIVAAALLEPYDL
jgi:hypothetical protein